MDSITRTVCWIVIGVMTIIWALEPSYNFKIEAALIVIITFLYLINTKISRIEQLLEERNDK